MKCRTERNAVRIYLKLCCMVVVIMWVAYGCATVRDAHRADITYDDVDDSDVCWAHVAGSWWTVFNDDTLNALVESALMDNTALRAAWLRVEQAGYASRAVAAGRLPQLAIGGTAGQVRRLTSGGGEAATLSQWGVSAAATYELDVWRRLSASIGQADALYEATSGDHKAMAISLAASVCEAWFDVNEQMQLLDILRAQLVLNEENLKSIERRYRRGLATLLDVYQQRELVASTHSLIPRAEALVEVARHRLAVLVGLFPGESSLSGIGFLPMLPSPVEGEVDAFVVEDRPDVRAAFLRLSAAEQAAAAAHRDRFPVLRLKTAASSTEEDPGDLGEDWSGEALLSIELPLIDGGRRRADVNRLQAATKERLENYAETVRQAMREVYDARILEAKQAETVEQLENELKASRDTLEQSRKRYANGLVDYLSVLTAQTRVQQLERSMVSSRRLQLSYRVQLCRAIAGDVTLPNKELE